MARIEGCATEPLVKLPKDPDACWSWLAQIDADGYPRKQMGGQPLRAQRWMWQVLFGRVPEGLVIYTSCGSQTCVNPHHLRCGFQADANRESVTTVLTPADVTEIRRSIDDGLMQVTLAARFGVSQQTISDIARNRRWGKKKRTAKRKATDE